MLSVLINVHMTLAARDCGSEKYFYSSSACVYNADKQTSEDVIPLKEEDAYPSDARRRVWVGETLLRADVSSLP